MTTRFADHLLEGTHAGRPAASGVPEGTLYSCSDHDLVYQALSGSWGTWLTAGGGGDVASDTIWNAKGDLAVGTASDTAARLGVGSNGQVLTADSGETTGLKWAAAGSGGAGGRGEYASKYNPDHETPTTTPAIAEEFNGSHGMTWSSAPGTTDDITNYPGFYRVKPSGTSGNWLYRSWTPGSSDVTLACKFSVSRDVSGENGSLTLYAANGSGNNPTEAVHIVHQLIGASLQTASVYPEDSGSFSVVGGEVTVDYYPRSREAIYLRLTRAITGPVWKGYYSHDGVTWFLVNATNGTKSLTIQSFGIQLDQAHEWSLDWIRVWDSIVEKVGA